MRRRTVILSGLAFALAFNGEALAKDPKPKQLTDAEKSALKQKAAQHQAELKDKKNEDKSPPLRHFRAASHSKSSDNWLGDKSSRNPTDKLFN